MKNYEIVKLDVNCAELEFSYLHFVSFVFPQFGKFSVLAFYNWSLLHGVFKDRRDADKEVEAASFLIEL